MDTKEQHQVAVPALGRSNIIENFYSFFVKVVHLQFIDFNG